MFGFQHSESGRWYSGGLIQNMQFKMIAGQGEAKLAAFGYSEAFAQFLKDSNLAFVADDGGIHIAALSHKNQMSRFVAG